MGQETKIEWTDRTASPWHGCTKVAAGCLNCYAERQSLRNPGTLGVWGDNGTRVKSKSFIKNLRAWNKIGEAQGKPIRVFPSICDPFEDRPEAGEWRREMFAVADECPWVILLLLTKRPENIQRMLSPVSRELWARRVAGISDQAFTPEQKTGLYRTNVWLGTSIATQADANRNIPELLKCRDLSPVLFVSAEPLIEAVDIRKLVHGHCPKCGNDDDGPWEQCNRCGHKRKQMPPLRKIDDHYVADLDWLIIGGESGPRARPCRPEWIRSLREQCQSAKVACFVKQMGANVITRNDFIECVFSNGESGWPDPDVEHDIHGFRENYQGADCRIRLRDPKGGDWSEWPEDLRVREFPPCQ